MTRLENMKPSFMYIQGKVKAWLSPFQWKEALTFLFFVCLSFVFWVLQSMQEEYEVQIKIPVTYTNMPQGMAFLQSPPEFITARVRDKGSALLNYTFGQKRARIAVDVNDTPGAQGSFRLSSKFIEGILLEQFASTTHLVSFDPQQIEIPYSRLSKKRLPVRFEGEVRTAAGFLVSGDVEISPAEVDVFAGEAVLDTLKAVSTVYTEIKNGKKTLNRKLKLREAGGALFVPDVVSVFIPIEAYTEKTLDIPVLSRNIPTGYTIRMFPPVVKLTCNVPLSLFKELSEQDFSLEVFLPGIDQNPSGILPLRLTRKPAWVDKSSLSQDSIEFILEQNR